MILSCPECSTRFLVANHLLPPFGRTVKCGSCKHEWHATPEDAEPEDAGPQTVDGASFESVPTSKTPVTEPVAPAPEANNDDVLEAAESADAPAEPESFTEAFERAAAEQHASRQLPVVVKPKIPTHILKIAAASIAFVWFVVAAHVHFHSWQGLPVLGGISGMFGDSNMGGLRFDSLKLTPQKQGQSTSYLLSGMLINESAAYRTVPVVRVQLKSADNKEVWSREYALDKRLKPGESYPFRISNVKTTFGDQVATVHVDLGNAMQLMFR